MSPGSQANRWLEFRLTGALLKKNDKAAVSSLGLKTQQRAVCIASLSDRRSFPAPKSVK
jgi:hypothetical protein